MNISSPYFITFEGSEGCGKSTQMMHLAEALHNREKTVHVPQEIITLREPGGTFIGEEIRTILKNNAHYNVMTPEAELLLFAASRAQLVREIIRPALARGAVVLCDRFLDSTTVYQGVARSLQNRDVAWMNHFVADKTLPHLTILLDLEVSIGQQRMQKRNHASTANIDRMEQEPLAFYEAIRAGYLALAEQEPDRFIVIDASLPAEKVTQEIITQLQQRTNGLF